MDNNFHETYYDVEKAIDLAFSGKFVLKFYDYLQFRGAKRKDIINFSKSGTATNVKNIIKDLEEYIEGGSDKIHKQLREGYGHISKPQARKIKKYLQDILDDACKYSYDKRPGRRKKRTK